MYLRQRRCFSSLPLKGGGLGRGADERANVIMEILTPSRLAPARKSALRTSPTSPFRGEVWHHRCRSLTRWKSTTGPPALSPRDSAVPLHHWKISPATPACPSAR